jgi:uncharacterized protein (UPF0261 family)
VPLGGGSVMDIAGGNFWEPEWNAAGHAILRDGLNKGIRYLEVEAHINSDVFADVVYEEVIRVVQ